MRTSRLYTKLVHTARFYFCSKAVKRVLVCPDKFKFSMSAAQVAESISQNIPATIGRKIITLADGGEGSLERISQSVQGQWIDCEVQDPLFRKIKASYYQSYLRESYIEMAMASGLSLISRQERNPLKTTSFGTGELILNSLKRGHRTIHLLIGGSATNDAGIGMAAALGYQFRDRSNRILSPVGQNLIRIEHIQHNQPQIYAMLCESNIMVYTDVTNPFTGINGASQVYGPQKGANSAMVHALEKGADHLNHLIMRKYGLDLNLMKGSGAAGGMGGGSVVFLRSKLMRGIDLIFSLTQFDQELQKSDLVITGEGKVDGQTLQGKVVKGVIDRATKYGKKVVVLCAYAEGGQQFRRQYPNVGLVQLLAGKEKASIEPQVTRGKLCRFVKEYFK